MKKFIVSFLSILFFGLVFSATKANASEDLEKLNIGTMPAPDSLPLYVAKEKGYFKKENLDVNLVPFKSPKDRDAALSSGQLNGAVSDIVALTSYINGNLGFKSATALTGYFGIVTNNENIKSISDLKGKTIAVMPRQTPTFYLNQELEKAGLKDKDVTIKEVPAIPVRLQMVEQKQVDATVLPDPFLSMAQAKKMKVLKKSNPEKYQTTLLVVDNNLTQNTKLRMKLIKAYNTAVEDINKHKSKDFKDILVKNLGFPEAIAEKYKLPHYKKAKKIPSKEMQEAFDYSLKEHIVKEKIDAKKYQLKIK